MTMRSIPAAIAALCAAAPAMAGGTFFSTFGGPDDLLQPLSEDRIESRFKADVTNWDMRLEYDSFPDAGDNTRAVSNSRPFFENQTFGFDLSFDADTSTISWTTSKDASVFSQSLAVSGFDFLNTIHLFTVGSRAAITLSDVAFTGLSMDVNAFPDINTQPSGPTFKETFLFFGNGFDLLSGDWSLTGQLTFGAFTVSNPNEGAKITIKLRQAELVPAPAGVALLGLVGLSGLRRRR